MRSFSLKLGSDFQNILFLIKFDRNGHNNIVNQGNLKGESVVAAILPSRMEVSYCTSGFFHS